MSRNTYIEGLSLPKRHPFHQSAIRLEEEFRVNTIKVDGVLRWRNSGNVPPQECLDFWKHIGKRFNMQKTVQARKREEKAFLDQFRQTQKRPTPEQLYEMKSAFGEGETVVNILTGERTKL